MISPLRKRSVIKEMIIEIIRKTHFVLYKLQQRKKKVEIKKRAKVTTNTFFEGHNVVHSNAYVFESYIGKGTYIHENSEIKRCIIGRYCSIGPNVKVVEGNHPTREYVSTHPLLYSDKKMAGLSFGASSNYDEYSYVDEEHKYFCEIGSDVWIGNSALIINGCRIGNGSIIAAGAVVTKDVPPYAIVGGVPARIIRFRFDDITIDELEAFKWWDKEDVWIKNNIKCFYDVNLLKDLIRYEFDG